MNGWMGMGMGNGDGEWKTHEVQRRDGGESCKCPIQRRGLSIPHE